MNFKVSLIVPVYNTSKYLKRCVESLKGQTYGNLEILLVDDGSTDESGLLCDQYAGEDGRIRVLHKENGGLVSAWKQGAKESTGDYLCFVDSDDWIDETMIEEMAVALTGNKREIISCDYILERAGDKKEVYQTLPPGIYEGQDLKEQVIPNLLGNENRPVSFSRCMKLTARELILDNQRYSPEKLKMGEDVSIMLPALLDCERLVILDHKAFYHYFHNESSMAHRYDAGLYQDICLLKEAMDSALADKLEGNTLSFMQDRALAEYIFLLMLAVKNEVRGNNWRKSLKAVQTLCKENEENRQILRTVKISVEGAANKLVYRTMISPSLFSVWLLKSAMTLYDRKNRSYV